MKIIFSHGWGCDHHIGNPLNALLQAEGFSVEFMDRGYWGRAKRLDFDPNALYVTHSQGLYDVLEYGQSPKALCVINGFTCFHQRDDWPHGVPDRLLQRMIRQWGRDPQKVWADFMDRAQLDQPQWGEGGDLLTLEAGLKQLQTADYRQVFAALTCPIKAIYGLEDAIVSPALSEQAFQACEVEAWQGGHFLIQSHVEQLAKTLVQWRGQIV